VEPLIAHGAGESKLLLVLNFCNHSALKVTCEKCGEAFNYKSSLTMHEKHCKSNGSDGNNNSIDSEFVCDSFSN
jgi:hypothetical protein